MIFLFYASGQDGFAKATIACIVSNLTLQLMCVLMQNKEKKRRVLLRELTAVLFFVKPGLDSMRVALDQEQDKDSILDARAELAFQKAVSLFTESIPGAMIQMYALVAGTDQSVAVVISLASSILTASFISTFVSYDLDVDKHRRKMNPDTYGYIPNGMSARLTVFMAMFMISAIQLFTRAFGCALCLVVSWPLFFATMFVEVAGE